MSDSNPTSSPEPRSPELLAAATSRLVIVDVQQKFVPVIPGIDKVIGNCVKLLKGAQVLDVPCSGAEQYPQGLGSTVEAIAALLPERSPKMRFSAGNLFSWANDSSVKQERHQVIIAGIETHVCILQTAFDLLAKGFDVHVVADSVNSRFPLDHEIGLRRMTDAGIRLVTTEMVLFEWCEVAGTDAFRQMSRIITGRDK
ncbi:MAG TPA: isochorismatase family protein [Planctomicrobium sp.]|nr:isochorismatase family protein [Planctomicrobium sp.]